MKREKNVSREEKARQPSEAELAELNWLANVGELASPVAHEFNNFLNAILLHVAVLEMRVPEEHRADLAEIRRQGSRMAAVVKELQQYRRRLQPAIAPLDVNRVVRETADELSRRPAGAAGLPARLAVLDEQGSALAADPQAVPVHLPLADGLPPVPAARGDLRRLVTFLLTNAAGAVAAAGGGMITVRTEAAADGVVLRVDDTAPAPPPDVLPELLEPTGQFREGTSNLEMAACRTLVRRLQGVIDAERGANGGLSVVVRLPA